MSQYREVKPLSQLKVKNLELINFKAYNYHYLDFEKNNKCKEFICFVGDNGIGKSTALNALQLIFSIYDGYDKDRLRIGMDKYIRKTKYNESNENGFRIVANINCELGDYQVVLTENGFEKDHPLKIKQDMSRICYAARFDQELRNFQLHTQYWNKFKELFESTTGYEINQTGTVFSVDEALKDYILDFTVKKPNEEILHKDCSNGEKKVIKSFSTMLNKEIKPKIILIDDIAMHVALDRQIELINCMKKCYPNSQIFSTTHSYRIKKNLQEVDSIYDLRLMHLNKYFTEQKWRIHVLDEIYDCLYKVQFSLSNNEELKEKGYKLKDELFGEISDVNKYKTSLNNYINEVNNFYISDVFLI